MSSQQVGPQIFPLFFQGQLPDEEVEPIPFDQGTNRYVVPTDFMESLLELVSQHEIRNFIETLNQTLAHYEPLDHISVHHKWVKISMVSWGTFLILGAFFLLIQLVINHGDLNSWLGYIGVLSIYISVIIVIVFFMKLCRTQEFQGSYGYFTPKISKVLKESQARFSKKNVTWELGKRLGSRNKPVEVYDLLYIKWKNLRPALQKSIDENSASTLNKSQALLGSTSSGDGLIQVIGIERR